MLSVSVGEEIGHSRHCPGTNDSMVVRGESTGSSKSEDVELASRFVDKLIANLESDAVVVEVVVAPNIEMNLEIVAGVEWVSLMLLRSISESLPLESALRI